MYAGGLAKTIVRDDYRLDHGPHHLFSQNETILKEIVDLFEKDEFGEMITPMENIVDYVLEIEGSKKIGNYIPGTKIPILSEKKLFTDQPDFAILFSWHIASELKRKLKKKGYKGKFIIPLPKPYIK